MVAGQRKPETQWTHKERKVANLDQRLKSLIMSVLPDDQIDSASSDEMKVTEVKVLIALADEERVSVGKESSRNSKCIKISMKKKGEYDIWAMKMEHYLIYTDYPIWEVIQKGNGPVNVSTDTNGVIKVLPPKTTEEILARERERKARTTLLMALPEDHLAKFHKITDAKDMLFCVSTENANQKFLRSLPSSWSQVSLVMRTKLGVDSLSFDDLYNNIRVFESDVKGSTGSSSSTQNVAFVSSKSTNSTNDVSIAYGVSTSSGYNSQRENSPSYTDELMYSFFANQSSGPHLDHKDQEQLDEFDLEEIDLKWQVAMISMRLKKFYKKTGRRLQFDAKEPVSFDKTKEEPKALVTLDGEGVDWTGHTEDEQENFALMAYSNSGSATEDNPQRALKNKGIVDNGCSRHMTGNKAYLAEYQDYNGGPVAFGGSKCYITGKGKIKTRKLDFEDMCFVKELQHFNLFSVSQMYDKKNNVLFTNTECLVLSYDFKLPDENQVLLRIPRQNNMYSFNLENIVPSGGLACLIAKVTVDESNKWHRRDIIEFCGSKGIKREYSNARTPQQNGVAKRKNRTLIEAARTMLADSFLPNTFWAEAVSTACYVLNRVLVTKPQNKTPYELITGKIPIISYIRPFGCHVTILNTIDHLGKFEGKSDEGFLVGYSLNSKAFRVYNLETKRVEENLHITFLENKPNVAGKGPNWLFDLDYLTDSMNYQTMRSENQANKTAGPKEANHSAGTQDNNDAGNFEIEAESAQDYFVLPIWSSYTSTVKSSEAKNESEKPNKNTGLKTNEEPVDQENQAFLEELERLKRQEKEANDAAQALRKEFAQDTRDLLLQARVARVARATSTNTVNTASTPVSTASPSGRLSYPDLTYTNQDDSQIPALEDIYDNPNDNIFTNASYDDEGAVTDFTNLETIMNISPIPTSRIHSIHPSTQILGDP
ncbi:ribonuclease H-like domain-containing protein [Tanacetum coccineum]